MKRKSGNIRQEAFSAALKGKKIPILTLDNKWYRLLDDRTRASVKGLENQLNNLLKRQGKLNTETKEIHKLKKKLMNEIVPLVDAASKTGDKSIEKKIDQNKKLVEDCNKRMESYKEELKELPRQIDQVNLQLMMITMDCCYDAMYDNTEEIEKIEKWVKEIRIELKKRLVRKQEMEQQNHQIYSYMHDVFGADVVDVFDMQYNPEKQHPIGPGRRRQAKKRNADSDSADIG
ncbi:MAG: hypothetical protein J1E40_10155, partial [Oscillospiraceae bacterium]|nr:hypothetical protein [Oscillospiraceae bacterium]